MRLLSKIWYRRSLLAAGFCVALSACDNPWLEDAPSLDSILSQGWLFGDTEPGATPQAAQPLYCYETIGVGDCHDQPLEDGGNRLVGYDGTPPASDGSPAQP